MPLKELTFWVDIPDRLLQNSLESELLQGIALMMMKQVVSPGVVDQIKIYPPGHSFVAYRENDGKRYYLSCVADDGDITFDVDPRRAQIMRGEDQRRFCQAMRLSMEPIDEKPEQ
ncbi:MAG: hypothetical protein GF334_10110 [Candidatus Altiarchaeales archaeon]|nr:hypothetical protein [Candidatus Altiarchaeales archaeon]